MPRVDICPGRRDVTVRRESSAPIVYAGSRSRGRMSIETAIERITEAESSDGMRDDDRDDQYEAYERTFRALQDVTPDDDDEGVVVVTDWIVEQLHSTGDRPSSRAVRQRARKYCQQNGYEIGDNDWLGA